MKTIKKYNVIGTCPDCGAGVIEVQGKYGLFEGCSSFPKCKWSCSVNDGNLGEMPDEYNIWNDYERDMADIGPIF